MEIWKDIEGYEGYYQISNLGRVKSLSRNTKIGSGFRTEPERIMKQLLINSGYYTVLLKKQGEQSRKLVHRLVAEAFIPNTEGKGDVNHINCDRLDNRVCNLEWVTRSENLLHAVKHGKFGGEYHYTKKLTRGQSRMAKLVINMETGVIFDCLKDAAEAHNVPYSTLTNRINGYSNTPTVFMYI